MSRSPSGCNRDSYADGFTAVSAYPRYFAFDEYEKEQYMPYEIGQPMNYMIGEGWQIGAPAYMIGASPSALPVPFGQGGFAAAPRLPLMPGSQQQAIPVVAMPPPTLVRRADPTTARAQPLGCNQETPIAVGATGTATATPQRIFKPERYVVPDTVGPNFVIDGIFIGVDRQSPAIGGISAESFGPNATYSAVEFTTCQLNQTITVNPRNIGGADRAFFSTFYGQTIY